MQRGILRALFIPSHCFNACESFLHSWKPVYFPREDPLRTKSEFCWCAHTISLVRNSNAAKDHDSPSKLAPITFVAPSRLLLPNMVGIRPKVLEVTHIFVEFCPIRTWKSDMLVSARGALLVGNLIFARAS